MAVSSSAEETERLEFAIAVHGGAGAWTDVDDEYRKVLAEELRRALVIGRDVLAAGGTSMDAVEQTVVALEDCPHFNAGRGATFNAVGTHELDASIMDGSNLACGAVACIRVAKNPIKIARRVMTDTRHIMLQGDGADEFAELIGADLVDAEYFWTPRLRQKWEKFKAAQEAEQADHHGTVGCVALDRHGNLAAATSTGGLQGKRFGRVGDSPIIAAGTYADNATCAVSGTGIGEEFIRHAICYDVAARMRYAGASLEEAVDAQVSQRAKRGSCGIIAVDSQGRIVIKSNTAAMARGWADSTGKLEAVMGP